MNLARACIVARNAVVAAVVALSAASARAKGVLCLTFDDPCWDGWVAAMPVFEKYGAHATFFPCGNVGTTNALAALKRLHDAGHTVGTHSIRHRNVPDVFFGEGGEGAVMFARKELSGVFSQFAKAGMKPEHFAYPNNRRTPETDALLAVFGGFKRFRAGAKTFRYNTNGVSIVDIDAAFFPVGELPRRRVMEGTGVGAYYNTDIEDICRGIRRAADRDEVFVIYSHDISMAPSGVGMKPEWLERMLSTASECGVAVKGFGELGDVEPQKPDAPMKVVLSFDDNVRDHLLVAAPELEKRGWRGLFCIVTDWVGRKDKLTWDDIRELKRRGHEIATHTKSHYIHGLGALVEQGKLDLVREEIAVSRDIIEREIGERPRYLCLPGSGYSPEVGKIAREEGLTTMLVPRMCFGQNTRDVAKSIDRLRDNGVPRYDFLVHGVRPEGGGWQPFKSLDEFIRFLDAVAAAEKDGKLVVTGYAGL